MKTITDEASALSYLVEQVYRRCRIQLRDGKQSMIRWRLSKRMRANNLEGLTAYAEFLRTKASDEEWTQAIDALTTNFTSFLREEEHFQFLVRQALPSVLQRGQIQFNIWSAACSTGEEPYTIGFYLSEHYPLDRGWSWNLCASDISTKVLASASRAIYAEDRITTVPTDWRKKYFQVGTGEWAGHYRVRSALSDRVQFRQINLIESYHHAHSFEVVFCRNVLIYFDRETQLQLVRRMCGFIKPGGFLITGHSESLTGLDLPLRCVKPSVYQLT
ncbi:MAG: protein-glutamate O-methyltransferase CheR [Verrucomicrobia bacterium]|nr:protein-glutamate O-methyltransferase CheR [Verrucomicrobiota bacterium]